MFGRKIGDIKAVHLEPDSTDPALDISFAAQPFSEVRREIPDSFLERVLTSRRIHLSGSTQPFVQKLIDLDHTSDLHYAKRILRKFSASALDQLAGPLLQLCKRWENDTANTREAGDILRNLEAFPVRVLRNDPNGLVAHCVMYGVHAGSFFEAFGSRALEFEERNSDFFTDLYQSLWRQNFEDSFGGIIRGMNRACVVEQPGLISELIEIYGEYIGIYPISFAHMHKRGLLDRKSDLMTYFRYYPDAERARELSTLSTSPWSANRRSIQVLEALVEAYNVPLQTLLQTPVCKEIKENPDPFINVARRFPYIFGELYQKFGAALPEEVAVRKRNIYKIIRRYGDYAPDVVEMEPPEKWSLGDETLFKRFGIYGGRVLKGVGQRHFELETSAERDILDRNREEFGLLNIHRYVGPGQHGKRDLTLLEENLRNLDPQRYADRPKAVFLYANDDHNDAYGRQFQLLHSFLEHYKLFVFEVGGVEAAIQAVKRVALLNGELDSGDPIIPVTLTAPLGHGNSDRLCFSVPPPDLSRLTGRGVVSNSAVVSGMEDNFFRECARYMSQNGKFIVSGCSVGKGGVLKDNVLTRGHAQAPHLEIIGPTRTVVAPRSAKFAESGEVLAFDHKTPPAYLLELKPQRLLTTRD